MSDSSGIDESKFDYNYVPPHLEARVRNYRKLSIGERLELTLELSMAAWNELGMAFDPDKTMDKCIRRINR